MNAKARHPRRFNTSGLLVGSFSVMNLLLAISVDVIPMIDSHFLNDSSSAMHIISSVDVTQISLINNKRTRTRIARIVRVVKFYDHLCRSQKRNIYDLITCVVDLSLLERPMVIENLIVSLISLCLSFARWRWMI